MEQKVTTQQKQLYLRKEILDQGFDAEEFIDYLNEEIKISAELEKIPFTELKDVVQGFKNKKKAEQAEQLRNQESSNRQSAIKDKPLIENLELITNAQEKGSKQRKITFEKYGNMQQDEIDKTFKCLKFSPQLPVITNPKIEVSDPQRKNVGGFFGIGGTSFLLFKINTYNYKWEVRRRYSDFQWLRRIICKFFPTYIAPPIPKKNAAKRTQRDLDKRMNTLSFFLNDLALVPEIFQSRYVLGFLSYSNDKQFEDLKREAEKKEAFETITSLETDTGTVTVKLNNETKAYMEQINNFMTGAEGLYKNITRDSKVLQNLVIDETNTLYRMGNHFADLHLLIRDFNNRLPNYKQTVLNDTYITLNNMMVEWGNIIRNQHSYLEKNLKNFFPYLRYELSSFRQLYQKVVELEEDYFKNKQVLDKKKQKIFQMGDVSKWEIPKAELSSIPSHVLNNRLEAAKVMLPKQSFQIEKKRMKFAFYQSQFAEHSSGLLDKGSNRFCENFKEFAIKIKVNTQQLTQLWTQIATNFADPKKKMVVQAPQAMDFNKQVEYDD